MDRLQELNEQPIKDEKEIADITSQITDIDKKLTSAVDIEPGTENLVQVMIAFGNRFSAKTGKEINKPQKMVFSFGEWQLFKQSFKRLGYQITEVINDPFNDAEELINKD